MATTVRPAVEGDLSAIVALTADHRRRLAAWAPTWWRPAAAADELHALWVGHLVADPGTVARVVENGGRVVGCAIALRQADRWIVDDVALAGDDRWPADGVRLLGAVTERPALTCVPTGHQARLRASGAAGLRPVSSYWIGTVATGAAGPPAVRPLPPDASVPAPPTHTFGAGFDPGAPGALALAAAGGIVVGSPPTPAPPVYDPGGTVCIVDRLVGDDRPGLLQAVRAAAARRGDVLVAVVTTPDDLDLHGHLAAAGFERTVDVLAWP